MKKILFLLIMSFICFSCLQHIGNYHKTFIVYDTTDTIKAKTLDNRVNISFLKKFNIDKNDTIDIIQYGSTIYVYKHSFTCNENNIIIKTTKR